MRAHLRSPPGRSWSSTRFRLANSRIAASPNTKPPTWAKYATPPPEPPMSMAANTACWRNHSPSTSSAGSSRIVKKKTMKITVTTRAFGNSSR